MEKHAPDAAAGNHTLWKRVVAWILRPGRLVLFALLIGALASGMLVRELDKPWRKPAASILFSEGSNHLTFGQKFMRPWQLLRDPGAAGQQARERMETAEWVQLGLWYGTLGICLWCLLLAATWVFWYPLASLPEADAATGKDGWRAACRGGRWSICLLLLALVLASASRLPYLNRAPLWDEQDNLRRSYHGYLDCRSYDAPPVWREAGMREAMWENRRGNNPALMSVSAQASNHLWRAITGAPRECFSPVAMRLPVALAALFGIAALWWMMNVFGWRQAAPVAALLAALHGMHAEYTIEARGYGFVLASVPLALGAACLAWQRVAWKDFWLFGGALFIGLWAYPGSVYFAATLGLVLALGFAWRWLVMKDTTARAGFVRLAVCGAVTAGAYAWLMAPYIPQMLLYLGDSFQEGYLPTWWYLMTWQMFASGLMFMFPQEYFLMEPGTSPSAAAWVFGTFFKQTPLMAIWSIVLVPASLLGGVVVYWRQRAARRALFLALATGVSALLFVWQSARADHFIYGWYIIFALPVFLALVAQGWVALATWLARRVPRAAWLRWTMPGMLLLGFAVLTHPAFDWPAYDLGTTSLNRRPTPNPWVKDTPDEIGRMEYERGNLLWVVYADGRQIVYHDYLTRADEVARHKRRRVEPQAVFGK